MKRCRFEGRCRIFGASEWAGNAMAKASLCKDESCDENEGEYKNPEGASEQTRKEHGRSLEQLLEASMGLIVENAFCRSEFK